MQTKHLCRAPLTVGVEQTCLYQPYYRMPTGKLNLQNHRGNSSHLYANIPNYNRESSEFFSILNLHSQEHLSTGLVPVRLGS